MKYSANEINVVYCSSDLFSEVCAVAISSLFENNKHLAGINVFVIDDKISEKNKQRIYYMAARYKRNVTFIPLPDPWEFYHDERFTIKSLGHTYARMILGDIMPEYVERIISLDSDTMVLNKIDELWNTDMGNHPIAGVDDCMGKVALVKTQHLKADSVHCNAGMYLIDLSVWREEKWTEQFFEYIKNLFDKGISLGGYEEEVINKILSERMLVLHSRFNLMTLEQVLSYKELMRFREPINYYTEEEIDEAKKNPVITHTTNFFYIQKRIFEENSDHPMRKQYENYRALTPWKNDPPMTVNPTWKQFMMKKVWHMMPRAMSIRVANLVRNEVRPRLEKKA
ncbi:glycosyltransferase family 8 protein [Desulfosporosinus sp. BG]|uniref:glycosyltransferase family 8 protein n=1 Tax=Desulfosporosinus sp. BG TaxID=1633135 RepID=UPI00083A5E70|nr:glycosyltransferase family 8 protein [Desulfosporosinus sp. BG]ODA39139.1 Glycosyl transferase [Desulfosporosinus sp. BG]